MVDPRYTDLCIYNDDVISTHMCIHNYELYL